MHINEVKTAKCGLEMTLIAWRKKNDIDVMFSDGVIVREKTYQNFKRGNIGHPDHDTQKERFSSRLHETSIANNGQLMTIIRYNNAKDLDVMFEDGFIKYNTEYKHFKSGGIQNPNFVVKKDQKLSDRVGESYIYNGVSYRITGYNGANDITVLTSDIGLIKSTYSAFKRHKELGKRKRLSLKIESKQIKTNSGVNLTVVKYNNAKDVIVKFEDDSIKSVSLFQLENRWGISLHRGSEFGNFIINKKIKSTKDGTFYLCSCKNCGYKDILSPSEIIKHICNKDL